MGLTTSEKKLEFDDSKEDLIKIILSDPKFSTDGKFDCRELNGYGKDCLNKVLPKLLGIKVD